MASGSALGILFVVHVSVYLIVILLEQTECSEHVVDQEENLLMTNVLLVLIIS